MIPITDDINFIKKLPLDEQKEYLKAYLKADQLKLKSKCTADFLEFIQFVTGMLSIWKGLMSSIRKVIIG